MNYLIVRNPQSRLLPQFIRAILGEEYMTVVVQPDFTNDIREARVFPSYQWADAYVHDRDGKMRPYAHGCIIRMTLRAHTIRPVEDEGEKGKAS